MTITGRVIIMFDITQQKVKHLFDYHPSGNLIRRVSVSNNTKAGDEVGYIGERGYRLVGVDYTLFKLHRLIFLWHYGYMPESIDHIDRDTANNKIENLRKCRHSQNMWNTKLSKKNTSGIKGVHWRKESSERIARISLNGKRIHLGSFQDISDAEEAITEARTNMHGEFANDGLNAAIDNLK